MYSVRNDVILNILNERIADDLSEEYTKKTGKNIFIAFECDDNVPVLRVNEVRLNVREFFNETKNNYIVDCLNDWLDDSYSDIEGMVYEVIYS